MTTDMELIGRVGAGDQEALEELYNRYYKRLSRFMHRMTGDSELVVELVNDVFLVVWHKSSGFRGDSSASTWILGIGYHKALKALKARRVTLPLDALDLRAPIDPEMAAGHLDLVGFCGIGRGVWLRLFAGFRRGRGLLVCL